ncbi:MAG: helix-turn-helix domain-containing protein [Chitinivibrionales bacterium]|nr:helix-turn-helix domain-containing protein [Chitinivibrionales bacterium]
MQIQPQSVFQTATTGLQLKNRKEFPLALLYKQVIDNSGPDSSLHAHNHLELGYCHEGCGLLFAGRKIIPYQAGDVCVIAGKEHHCLLSRQSATTRWSLAALYPAGVMMPLGHDPALADDSIFNSDAFCNIVRPAQSRPVCSTLMDLIDEMRREREGYPSIVRAQTLYLMSLLHREAKASLNIPTPQAAGATSQIQRISAALDYICTHFQRKIRIETLAQQCYMSVTHFRRTFESALGKRPLNYIMQVRIAMAAVELLTTAHTAEQIGYSNGFATVSCFQRKFKEFMGASPRKWRMNQQH